MYLPSSDPRQYTLRGSETRTKLTLPSDRIQLL